ncbi:hypothetical protein Tco_0232698 [Tanacetum coccineum]
MPAKDDLRNAYVKIVMTFHKKSRALIDSLLKGGLLKITKLNLFYVMEKAAKTRKSNDAKKELHQLHLDEEALRETLKEQAIDEKAREKKIRQKQDDDDDGEFFMNFGVVRYDSEYESSN